MINVSTMFLIGYKLRADLNSNSALRKMDCEVIQIKYGKHSIDKCLSGGREWIMPEFTSSARNNL